MDAPNDLGAEGTTLWNAINETRIISAPLAPLVHNACREVDILDGLSKQIRDNPLTLENSRGDTIANPILGELRQHLTTLKTVLNSLGYTTLLEGATEEDDLTAQIAKVKQLRAVK